MSTDIILPNYNSEFYIGNAMLLLESTFDLLVNDW